MQGRGSVSAKGKAHGGPGCQSVCGRRARAVRAREDDGEGEVDAERVDGTGAGAGAGALGFLCEGAARVEAVGECEIQIQARETITDLARKELAYTGEWEGGKRLSGRSQEIEAYACQLRGASRGRRGSLAFGSTARGDGELLRTVGSIRHVHRSGKQW